MLFVKTIVRGCFTRITSRALNDCNEDSEDEVDRQAWGSLLVTMQTRKRRWFGAGARGLAAFADTVYSNIPC
jgi:hypothetical protein